MAAHRFRLSPDLAARVASLASDLSALADEHSEAWDERSEKWQESEKGLAVEAWIENLRELGDTLETFEDEPA